MRRSNEHLHTHWTVNRGIHDDDNQANSLISMILDSGATDCHVSPKRTHSRLLEGRAHDQVSMMVDLMMFDVKMMRCLIDGWIHDTHHAVATEYW